MSKVPINQNFIMPDFHMVNKNQASTQFILMDPENSNLYLLHQYYCADSDDFKDLISLLESQGKQGQQCPYILNPISYLPIKFTDENFQTSHFIQVVYEYGSHTLEQELFLRINEHKNPFEEHQIWSIFGSCVLALGYLKTNQFTHGSVCLNDIFVTKDGQIKLCHPMLRTYDHIYNSQQQEQYFQRVIGQSYYFAPQQLPQLDIFRKSILKTNYSVQQIFKSDVFSLGMAMISLCVLGPVSDCYVKKYSIQNSKILIDNNKLEQYFYALQQIYSQDLINLLFSMVSYNFQQRISIQQLSEIITFLIQKKNTQEKENYWQRCESPQYSTQNISTKKKQYKSSQKKIDKHSRVSQVSRISGRSQDESCSYQSIKKTYCEPDKQDLPSLIPFMSAIDTENIDRQYSQQQNASQSLIINQTLKQYINNDNSDYNSLVNQTFLCEEFQKKIKQKKCFSPQQVVSIVMTSKQLGSLPDDSQSFVVEKHVINQDQSDQQNQFNSANRNHAIHNPYQNNLKLYLNNLKQQKKDDFIQPNNTNINYVDTGTYISSARTYNEVFSNQNFIPKQPLLSQLKDQALINPSIEKISQKQSLKSSMTISLTKDYRSFLQNQNKNPSNPYTDPSFLQAIRSDVNKILKKRKMKVTISNSQTQKINNTNKKLATQQQIFINGVKINKNVESLQVNQKSQQNKIPYFNNKIIYEDPNNVPHSNYFQHKNQFSQKVSKLR